jgi:hypothetical protein
LKVTDEIQALNLILSSKRVYYDLIEVLDCQQVKENKVDDINDIKLHDWNNNIIIRQWNDLLDPSIEFRYFVYQSNLTAISQYIDHMRDIWYFRFFLLFVFFPIFLFSFLHCFFFLSFRPIS